jgi:Holliday junction resolvase RusA-like endonuclease
MNTIIRLDDFKPTPLNQMYEPCIRNNKPSIKLSKKAKEDKKFLQFQAVKQRRTTSLLEGELYLYMDIDVVGKKRIDSDALFKQTLDAFEGIIYKNDAQVVDLRSRVHRGATKKTLSLLELEK